MALIDGFPGASGTVDSTELRKNLAGLIVRDTAGVPRSGVFPRHTNALVTSRTDMALNVAAFEGVSVRGGGPLFIANDGVTQSPALATAPASNSRIDVLYFKQNESVAPYADANNLPIFGVVTGTAAASPTKPSIAGIGGATELATITIPSTATATNSSGVVITNTFQYTAASGGSVMFRSKTEMDTFAAAEGQSAYRLDTKGVEFRRAGAWSPQVLPHAEYTLSVTSLPDATLFSAFSYTADSARSTDSTFTNIVSSKLRLPPGVYALAVVGTLSVIATGRCALLITRGSEDLARGTVFAGENTLSTTVPNLYVAAVNADITVALIKTTGGNHNFTGRLRVTRISGV